MLLLQRYAFSPKKWVGVCYVDDGGQGTKTRFLLWIHTYAIALKIWRLYLCETCEIYTDHKSLKYIFQQKDLKLKLRRWMKLLKYNDCKIVYHPKKENVVVDAFNQQKIYGFNNINYNTYNILFGYHLMVRSTISCALCCLVGCFNKFCYFFYSNFFKFSNCICTYTLSTDHTYFLLKTLKY